MIPHSIFQLSMHHVIFDLTLTAVAIGDEPYCNFLTPVASALKSFSNPHSCCVLSDPIYFIFFKKVSLSCENKLLIF